jgi:hypothetical protein
MNTKQQSLAKSIDDLDLRPIEKVYLWLAYKQEKPVSWIGANFPLDINNDKTREIFTWLKEANLFYKIQPDDPTFLFVSSDPKLLEEILPVYNLDSREAILIKARLFGYPIETAEAQSSFYNLQSDGTKKILGTGFHARFDKRKFPHRWLPYLFYTVRKGHEYEDSLVAKKWYETIKKDLPQVHSQILKTIKTLE